MPPRVDSLDLASLSLSSGEGRKLDLAVALDPFEMAGERYQVVAQAGSQPLIEVRLELSRTIGAGYAMRLGFEACLNGPCMRCLQDAAPSFAVDAHEVSQPGEVEDLDSPYVEAGVLDLQGWVRDALALAIGPTILCRPDCPGLCPVCGIVLAGAPPGHHHEAQPDPRWAKLSEIRFQ